MTLSRVLAKLLSGDFVKIAGIGRVAEPWLTEVAGVVLCGYLFFIRKDLARARSIPSVQEVL